MNDSKQAEYRVMFRTEEKSCKNSKFGILGFELTQLDAEWSCRELMDIIAEHHPENHTEFIVEDARTNKIVFRLEQLPRKRKSSGSKRSNESQAMKTAV